MTFRVASRAVLVLSLGIVTALFRFLTLEGIPNDHFLHLTGAQQMLFGEWPTRDFADPGLPLMYAVSAMAQAIGGYTLLSEAVLVAVAFGVAASFTAVAVLQLTSSMPLALGATLLEVAIVPRTYGYPKLLLYAVAFVLFQRYVSRPTLSRLTTMAAWAAIAFLFRHDHGLYIAFGGAITALLASENKVEKVSPRRLAVFVGIVVALLVPYLAYVQVFGGLPIYLRTAIEFSARESARQGRVWPNPFVTDQPAHAVVLYLFHLVPVVAMALLAYRPRDASRLLPLVAVAIPVNFSFMRDPLPTRLPDAVVPAVVLGSWLVWCAWHARRWKAFWVSLSLGGLVVAASSIVVVGSTADQIGRMGLNGQWNEVLDRFNERTAELRARFAEKQIPTHAVAALEQFFSYLDRCTTPSDRLLVAGFMPEIPYFARRPFAGGQSTFVSGYYGSAENQRLVIERLRSQRAPFVLMPNTELAEFNQGFPMVAEYLRTRYAHLTDVRIDDETSIDIQLDRSLTGAIDVATGWPCVR